jgi:hypothetical protein
MLTYDGEDYWRDRALGAENNIINTVAVGRGTAAESKTDTGLVNEVFRATVPDDDNLLTFAPRTIPDEQIHGRCIAELSISGGMEVASGTGITESAIIAGGGGGQGSGRCVYRRTFASIGVSEGLETTIRHPFDIE